MRGPQKKDFVEVVRSGWGADAPRWVMVLAERCTEDRQSTVAKRLGVSASMISAVLAGTYAAKGGNTGNLEARVRGAYLGETHLCPVLGEIGADRCRDEQGQPFRATSALRAQLFHACRTCPHNPDNGE